MPIAAIIRLVRERRPELAERLEHLRRTDPERFADVLAEALIVRLEDILAEQGPGPRPPGIAPQPRAFGPGPRARFREMPERRDGRRRERAELEERAGQLEAELRELERGDASPEQRERVRAELARIQDRMRELLGPPERGGRERRAADLENRVRELQRDGEELERKAAALEARLQELEENGAPPERQEEVRAALERTRQTLADVRERLEDADRQRGRLERDTVFRKLQRRNDELEQRSGRLARKLRELRERGAGPEDQEEVLAALRNTVNEHFEVRSELREFELKRIRAELEHLQRTVEQMHGDLERRERERDAIIERRIRQLIGEDTEGW